MQSLRVEVAALLCIIALVNTCLAVSWLIRDRRVKVGICLLYWIQHGFTVVYSFLSALVSVLVCILYRGESAGDCVRFLIVLCLSQSLVYLPYAWRVSEFRREESPPTGKRG